MDSENRDEQLVSFADTIGLFYEELGVPRTWGRVLGWLLVCEPDYQSAEDLARSLDASRGSISMAMRSLIRAGSVERQTKRGDRRTYYRIRPGAWTAVFEQHIQSTRKLRELSKQGLDLLNDEPTGRALRLQELYDLATFYEREVTALLTQWTQQNHQVIAAD